MLLGLTGNSGNLISEIGFRSERNILGLIGFNLGLINPEIRSGNGGGIFTIRFSRDGPFQISRSFHICGVLRWARISGADPLITAEVSKFSRARQGKGVSGRRLRTIDSVNDLSKSVDPLSPRTGRGLGVQGHVLLSLRAGDRTISRGGACCARPWRLACRERCGCVSANEQQCVFFWRRLPLF